jgi:hypothetical protein
MTKERHSPFGGCGLVVPVSRHSGNLPGESDRMFRSQGIMGEAMTLLQQAATILKTEPEMARLLEDKLASLSQELEFH